jgi:hypothetical protein
MRGQPIPMLLLNLGFCACFAYAAAMQYNDPDPLPWMAIYGGAALATQLWRRVRGGVLLNALVGGVAVVWAAVLFASLPRWPSRDELFTTRPMTGDDVEVAREALGLALVAVWMWTLFLFGRRRDARRRA